ncbi:MAG: choice-of-anchor D domain-containing protein [Phycisphaeraceae bacterium]|nr:choice-of-anchor D domain-containing protein [Phycisphaeraceae bacterium]
MPLRGEDPSVQPARIRPADTADDPTRLPDHEPWQGLLPLEPRLLMAAEVALFGGLDADVEIAAGDSTPAFVDGTHFGGAFVDDAATIHTAARTFTVKNLGGTVLGLTGTPRVQISGDVSDFTVTTSFSTNKLGWQDSVTFTITFNPTAPGVRTATVRVPNNDSNEFNYTFTIVGVGFDPAGSGTEFTPVSVVGGAYYYTLLPGATEDRAATTGDAIDVNRYVMPVGASNYISPTSDHSLPVTVNLDSSNASSLLVSSLIGMRTGELRIILLPANSGIYTGLLNTIPAVYAAEMLSIRSAAASQPSVALTGKDDTPIANGDDSPSTTDGTNLGVTRQGQQLTQTFTLNITGDNFALLGNPNVVISGADASNFTASTVSGAGATRTFTITFRNATANGVYSAVVTIPTNDPDNLFLTFTVRATLAPGVFDEAWYLAQNSDVAADVDNGTWASGYEHFAALGQTEGRRANPIFDEAYYLAHNPDVAADVGAVWQTGFEHFAALGQTETRRFSRYFDNAVYLRLNPSVASAVAAGTWKSGLEQYIVAGAAAGNRVSPYFDEDLYLRLNSDVQDLITAAAYENGFIHFIEVGRTENRTFSRFFDETFYLEQNLDVAADVGADPANPWRTGFDHFLEMGQYENRLFTKYFDEAVYLGVNTAVASAVTAGTWASGFEHFIARGWSEGRQFFALFDEAYYLAQYPIVAADVGPSLEWDSGFDHFIHAGYNESRRYSTYFNEQAYLAANPDVAAGVPDPWLTGFRHFVTYGQFEGRTAV